MGAFKELLVERYDEVHFNELDMTIDALERELEVLDLKLEIIDLECAQALEQASLLLPGFEVTSSGRFRYIN